MTSSKLKKAFERTRTVESVSEQTSGMAQLRDTPSKFDLARAAVSHKAEPAQVPSATPAPARKSTLQIPAGDLTDASAEYRQWCMENGYRPKTNIEIPLGKLKQNPYNARHFYLPSKIQDLVVNIAETTQEQPIHVTPDYSNPGFFFVTDGGRRWRALEVLKKSHALALVVDVPLGVQSYKLSHDLNTTKEDQTIFDDAMKWSVMLAEGVFKSGREIAQVLGIAEGTVSNILSLKELPEKLLALMVAIPREEMGLRKAYEVRRYWIESGRDDAATETLIQQIANGNYPIKRVQAAIAAIKSSPAGKVKSRPVSNRRVDFRLPNGTQAGSLKTYGEDRLDLLVSGLPLEVRDELQVLIQTALQRYVSTNPDPDGEGSAA
ncbi:MAG: ParB/RepB/Spo0J family partition protein [Pseudomonadota bacterium]